ncbi:hypothetical protein Tco_1568555 [Tanacetum coccineum]
MRWKVVVMVRLSKRVTRCFLRVQGCKEVMEVLVRCWSDGDVVPTSVPVPCLPFDAVVIIVTVVIVTVILVVVVVDDVSPILKLLVYGFEAVTFPSMLWGSPPMKASISFSVFGIMFGHKTANSWNLLILGDLVGLFYSNTLGICIPPGQDVIVFLSVLAIVAACASQHRQQSVARWQPES